MKEFLEAIEKNEELKNKILALKGDPEAIAKAIEIAKEYGFEISEEDMVEERNKHFGRPYSEEELAAVAGGDSCYCSLAGGGEASNSIEITCACVLGGGGEYHDADGGKSCRCWCVMVGQGD